MNGAADVAEAGVAHESSGEQTGLAEDLEAVADAENEAAGGGEAADGIHNWREAGDGSGAQVISVGEAAGDEDGVAAFEVGGLVPEEGCRLSEQLGDDVLGVVVAVGTGKDEDAKLHMPRVAPSAGQAAGANGRRGLCALQMRNLANCQLVRELVTGGFGSSPSKV